MFQSLFWWILYCDPGLILFVWVDLNVSILVLVDLILWRNSKKKAIFYGEVSILVLVDLILWQKIGWQGFLHRSVSILVLVDLILWPLHCLTLFYSWFCFNPCFGGSHIVTATSMGIIANQLSFNPCFGGSHIVTLSFEYEPPRGKIVSILVLVDLILWLYWNEGRRIINPDVSILVLVDLILWRRSCIYCCTHIRFQSLFWWISYCDDGTPSATAMCHLVSILVLVDLILWPMYFSPQWPLTSGFNPCFGGSHIVTSLQLTHNYC